MKFSEPLIQSEIIMLKELYHNGPTHRLRQRSHIILMSNSKFTINEIAKTMSLDRDTISGVLTNWQSFGLMGLYDARKSGRQPIFTHDDEEKIIEKIAKNPQNLKNVTAEINNDTGKKSSTKTVKRILKKHNKIWKRMKKTLAGKPDKDGLQKAEAEISKLKKKELEGKIDLHYFDESGFSLTPSVGYAWQDIGDNIEIMSARSKKINVLGFLNPTKNQLIPWTFNCNIDSDILVSVFDEFAKNIEKETWVILDNASFHTSGIVQDKIKDWEEKNLFLYYLPPYCPQLNMIERVWQFMKYQWMPVQAYESFGSLSDSVNTILSGYGSEYLITFV